MKKLTLFMIFNLFLSLVTFSEKLTFITENYAPLNYIQFGSLKGPAVEIVQLLMKETNMEQEIKVFPWKRAYASTLANNGNVLFSTTRTVNRENLFKWVGPLAEKRYSFYAKKSKNIRINNIGEISKYRVGSQVGGANAIYLKTLDLDNLQLINSPEQNIKKLNLDRIDFWYTSASTFEFMLNKFNLNKNDYEEVFIAKKSLLYIAFNINTDDKLIDLWQRKFDKLYENGKIKEIYLKYNLEALYPNR